MFPWLDLPSVSTPDPAINLRFQVNEAQDREIQRLRLVNDFLRSEIYKAERDESKLLRRAVAA